MGGYIRIFVAGIAGVALVGVALYARTSATADTTPDAQPAAVTPVARAYQDIPDTDGDGVPDWQQELARPEISEDDSETPAFEPKTLTDHFAVNFFTSYLMQESRGGANQQALVAQGLAQVAALNTSTLYTRNDIAIGNDSGAAALRAYGNRAGSIILTYGRNDRALDDEVTILMRAIEGKDPGALADLATIEQRYADIVRELLAMPVPLSLASQHLDLVNALQAWKDGVAGMQLVFEDPLAALIRIKRYQEDTAGFASAVEGVRRTLEAAGIFYDSAEGGAFFFSLRP